MDTGYALIAVWPIVDEDYTRDELIAQASRKLRGVAFRAGAKLVPHNSTVTWDVIGDGAELPGWEWYAGPLLLATVDRVIKRVTSDPPHGDLEPLDERDMIRQELAA